MKELIKEIRSYLHLSQQETADYLGVTFATVNRWENGRAIPNRLAQQKLYDLCIEREVPLMNLIHERIDKAVAGIKHSPDRLLLFHGSKSGLAGEIAPISRDRCDFGKGFYMGTQAEQPLTLICDFEQSKFYVVSLKVSSLKTLHISPDVEWAMAVAYHRGKMEGIKGTVMYERYQKKFEGCDLIIGSIANDRMFYVLDNFFLGNITDLALVNSLSALQLGEQYVAVSKKGCEEVQIEREILLSYLERQCLRDVSEQNRARGISLANDICKNYRREGRFFDEILEEAGGGR